MRKVMVIGSVIMLFLSLAMAGTILAQGGGQSGGPDQTSATWLGVYVSETSDGVVITRVVTDSPADTGGLLVDDVIVSVDDQAIDSAATLTSAVQAHAEGDVVAITVLRGDSEMTLDITLGITSDRDKRQPDQLTADMDPLVMAETVLHVDLSAVDEGYQVLAGHARPDNLLVADDIITAANDTPITEVDWPTLVSDLAGQDSPVVTLTVLRDGEEISVDFTQLGLRAPGARGGHGGPGRDGRNGRDPFSGGTKQFKIPGSGNTQDAVPAAPNADTSDSQVL